MNAEKFISVSKYLISPILVSLYPVIFLYAFNIQMLSLDQTYMPLLVAFILAIISFAISSLIMKSMLKGSIAAVCLLIVFWNYDLFYQALHYLFGFRQRYALPLVLILLFVLLFLLRIYSRTERLKILNILITAVAAFLIFINIIIIIPAEIDKSRITTTDIIDQAINEHSSLETESYPDVYLLIFDEYARLDTIEEEWGYDNSQFAEDMKSRGLFLAKESMVSSPSTIKTMPELLNLKYFEEEKNDAELINLYYNNQLFSFFHNLGYDIYFLDGYDHPLLKNYPEYVERITYAGLQSKMYSIFVDPFNALLFERSILLPFESWLPFKQPGLYYYEGNQGFFDYLSNIYPRADSPKFVFAHVWFPHLPFVFDREGNLTNNEVHFFQYQDYEAEKLKEMYLEQYIYATKVITEIVDNIIAKSDNEVIIVIQSDHGPRPSSTGITGNDHGLKVLNAIYFYDGEYDKLRDDISPVNTMRIVLNRYFGKNLKMLE